MRHSLTQTLMPILQRLSYRWVTSCVNVTFTVMVGPTANDQIDDDFMFIPQITPIASHFEQIATSLSLPSRSHSSIRDLQHPPFNDTPLKDLMNHLRHSQLVQRSHPLQYDEDVRNTLAANVSVHSQPLLNLGRADDFLQGGLESLETPGGNLSHAHGRAWHLLLGIRKWSIATSWTP